MTDDKTGTKIAILMNNASALLTNGTVYRSLYSHVNLYIISI